MSNATTYLVLVAGTEVARKSKKQSAVDFAEGLRVENPTDTIEVHTGAGTVVHSVKVKGTHAKPWTRTETHDGMEVEVPAGFTVAYTRKRVGAVVARADDKSGWVVLTEGGDTYEVANTVEAREVTNQLAAQHREERAAQLEADKKAKAKAKAKREADRAAAREAKEKEKKAASAAA